MQHIPMQSATALSAAIRDRQISCEELMRASLEVIQRLNPAFNAIVSLRDGDALLAQAREKDALLRRGRRQGWLHGFPVAIKDTSDAQGLPTSNGSPLAPTAPAQSDSPHVARMRAAGAIVIGKTNTPEFALGSHTFNEVFGTTRNAWVPALSAGGSSGGAAVATALHMVPLADGSDLMGSLRNPAGFNNVIGFRPSRGRVPGVFAGDLFMRQMTTNGPIARSVEDAARLLCVQAGFDARSPLSLAEPFPTADELRLDFDPSHVRIGWLGAIWPDLPFERGMLEQCSNALAVFRSLGCHVEDCSLDVPREENWLAWNRLRQAQVGHSLAPYYEDPDRRRLLKPEARWEVEQFMQLPASAVMQASETRSRVYRAFLSLFETCDFVVAPTAQVYPFASSMRWPQGIEGVAADTYHRWMEVATPFTLAGIPTLNLRAGFSATGAPAGIQMAGRPHGDLDVLRMGHAYDRACPWSALVPPVHTRTGADAGPEARAVP